MAPFAKLRGHSKLLMSESPISTPCVGRCSTVFGDLVCRGCKRFLHEVVDWNRYPDVQKQAVWQRLDQLLEQVMRTHVEVFAPQLLADALQSHRLEGGERPAYCQAYLLISRVSRLGSLAACGISLLPAFADWPLPRLRDAIDDAYFVLSEAHYQRYIFPAVSPKSRP